MASGRVPKTSMIFLKAREEGSNSAAAGTDGGALTDTSMHRKRINLREKEAGLACSPAPNRVDVHMQKMILDRHPLYRQSVINITNK